MSIALVIVDMQNDFADPNGSLFVDGGDTITTAINAESAATEAAGGHVYYTQDWHPPETPHFADFGGVWPIHCVRDTWGAELRPDLDVRGPIVRKGVGGEDGYSGFTMRDPETGEEVPTELNSLLRADGTTSVVVVGLALDVCVKATALDAVANGYDTTVLADQSAAVNLQPGDGDAAIEELRAAGVTVR
ncbi:MAG: isochorismatase family protein [Acidimicrobiales bacterium]|nr:isochorismatase family protein [Acidimicrobiales bacterium]RZV48788.1 MAG: isochorismatase family protein [Acidimicrobiales bacterium]